MASEGLPPRRVGAVIASHIPTPREPIAEVVAEARPETSDLARRFAVIRRYLPVLLAASMAGGAVGWYAQSREGPLYEAATTVRFTDVRSRVVPGVANETPTNWQWDPVKSQAELLTTRATLQGAVDAGMLQLRPVGDASLLVLSGLDASRVKTADTLSLAFDTATVTAVYGGKKATAPYAAPLIVGELLFQVPARPSAQTARFVVEPRESVIGQLVNVRVNRRLDTDIADFTLQGSDPAFLQRALNAMTLSLQSLSRASDRQFAQERRRFLDEQARKTDSILGVQRSRLSEFRTRTQAFNAKEKVSQQQTSLAATRTRREELAADRSVFASLLSRALSAREAGDPSQLKSLIGAPGIAENAIIAEQFSRLQRLSATRDSLTGGPFASAASNPDVQRITAQIESSTDDLISAVRSQLNTYDARISALDGLLARATAEASTMPSTEAEEDRLLQETMAAQKIADQLNEEQQRARIAEVAEGGKVEIIDLARLPESVINQSSTRKTLLGALVGLGIALLVVFLFEELNTSLRRQEDVERLLQLPTLGSIPALDRQSANGGRSILKRIGVKKHSNGSALIRQGDSPVFESYRAIRTSLIFSNAVESLRSVAITSSSPGDGKSTTVANLATAFAQQGLRIIAIDCDLRRGSLHKLFKLPRGPGLTHAIASGSDLESVVRETSTPNLSVVTTGVQPPNPSELLGSQRLRDLLIQAQEQYDLVIIDTPPVLAAADASVIASMVDGVILLVRMGSTSKSAAKAAQERLRLVGARVLGSVLNDPSELLESTEQYYYYDYSSNGSSNS